jgi:CelD/BcsL family acetyltransferase involved in cellulose biosynthesis
MSLATAQPTPISPQTFDVRLLPLPPLDELERRWTDLQKRSDCSFFLSWTWIGGWLKWLPAPYKPRLIEVCRADQTVGLAILVRSKARRAYGLVRSRRLHLHTTGDPALDELTIEHNGILALRQMETVVTNFIVEHLSSNELAWDELVLDGIDPAFVPDLSNGSGAVMVSRSTAVHSVDLNRVRLSSSGFVGLLGASTRYNIRASTRHFERSGPLQLDAAGNVDEALDFMSKLKAMQAPRWNARGKRSSFQEPQFERFHRALIRAAFDSGCIQLLRIRVGDNTLGYLYDFIHNGSVMQYQLGIDYEQFGGSRTPGLVAIRLAIERAAAQGHNRYSFLAGDVDYKKRMATTSDRMFWSIVRRDRIQFRLEESLRRARHRYRRLRVAE